LEPDVHVIFGDLGASHAFSLCTACSFSNNVCDAQTCAGNTSVGLVSEVARGAMMMLHVGDFACVRMAGPPPPPRCC
jgi:hypothetical protein